MSIIISRKYRADRGYGTCCYSVFRLKAEMEHLSQCLIKGEDIVSKEDLKETCSMG